MKDKKPFYILGAAAAVLLLLFVFFGNGGSRFDWSEHYEPKGKEPYGTFILYEVLSDYFPNNTFTEIKKSISEELLTDTLVKNNYVFIGESMFLDSADLATLLLFVSEGNTAFISSKTIPVDLMDELNEEECNYSLWQDYNVLSDTTASFNFFHPQLKTKKDFKFTYLDENIRANYGWNYIDDTFICDDAYSMIPLGTVNEKINFVKKEYGQGAFYLHTTPITFTNLYLHKKSGFTYANKVFSHLEEGNIYWDEHSREGEGFGRAYNRRKRGGDSRSITSDESLKYILAQPSLAWAWYLSVSLGLLYLFFRAKRKQRIIPVLEQNENTSFEFISTIGQLYFLKNDHKKLCLQKMKLFLAYIRDRYNLNTTNLDDAFVTKLTAKSEVSPTIIKNIFTFYKNIESSSFTSEQSLIDFHQRMDAFYKNCK